VFLAKVTGSIVSTQKVDVLRGQKLLIVEPVRLDPQTPPGKRKLISAGRTFVAIDTLGAGEGEMVLITQGSSARLTPETKNLPIDTVVIGIVDRVDVEQQTVFTQN